MIPSTEGRGWRGGDEGVLSGESLMCSQTVSLQIGVHVCACVHVCVFVCGRRGGLAADR